MTITVDDRFLDAAASVDELAADARQGLTAEAKWLPPRWFYDERGSALFERITELPEYYPTRTERQILADRADEIVAAAPAETVIELGSGSSAKTHLLLDAWQRLRTQVEEAFYEAGNAGLGVRHSNNNNGSPSEPCNNGFPKKAEAVRQSEQTPEHLSPELILEACPTLDDYGEPVRDLADIVSAGRYLRASLGAHESAWAEAVEEIGAVQAAIAVIYTLQLYEDDVAKNGGESRIKNPGGYFRALTRMVKAGKIDLAVELLALRRRRMA